ncbi:B2 protein [Nymphaea thermarum]|nr:B2 protein [Nymphaea thermarum]
MKECLSKQLFGLPASHFSYVRNIQTGLPLFLFSYNERILHGIYEAAGPGQMNIDPYAWTDGGIEKTKYPAQVHIRVRLECHPLSESQFRGILSKNYYSSTKFYFKLDHAQVDSLILLFKKYATTKTTPPTTFPRNTWLRINGSMNNVSHDDKVSRELAEINSLATSTFSMVQETKELSCAHVQRSTLKEDIEMLRSMSLDQGRQITILEEKEVESQAEILKLKMQVKELESQLVMTTEAVDHLPEDVPDDTTTSYIEEAIYLVGGYNGTSWLSKLDLYAPTCGSVLSLPSMSSPRSYAGVVSSHGCIYAIGGGDGCSWYDTVEIYNPSNKEWSCCSPLSCEKGSLAAASLKDMLFVLGGSNGIDSFSDVEMYDPVLGKWVLVGSMLHEVCLHRKSENLTCVLGVTMYVGVFSLSRVNICVFWHLFHSYFGLFIIRRAVTQHGCGYKTHFWHDNFNFCTFLVYFSIFVYLVYFSFSVQ